MERAILVAVARADMAICWLLALPWRRIALSLLIAWWIIHAVKKVASGDDRKANDG